MYDLHEDAQLRLAIAQSQQEAAVEGRSCTAKPEHTALSAAGAAPEEAGGVEAAAGGAAVPSATRQRAASSPEQTGSPEQTASPEQTGPPDAAAGGAPPPVRASDRSMPEWTDGVEDGSAPGLAPSNRGAPDEAAGGGIRAGVPAAVARPAAPPASPLRVVAPPSGHSAATASTQRSAAVSGNVPPEVAAAVRQALEQAQAKRFVEADKCLAEIVARFPEHGESREVVAAMETVAMCKHFHDKG